MYGESYDLAEKVNVWHLLAIQIAKEIMMDELTYIHYYKICYFLTHFSRHV